MPRDLSIDLIDPLVAARDTLARVGGAALVRAALAVEAPAAETVWVAGAGKAIGAMAQGALAVLGGRTRLGVLIGKHPHEGLPVHLAGHPVPDERGVAATGMLLRWLGERTAADEVVLLLSGGASALLAAPVVGVPLASLQVVTARLLAQGATIAEINTVRRHLGQALGGRMAAATPAAIRALVLSDVIGDDPAAIGSGPVSADPTSFADALALARRHGLDEVVCAYLERGARGEVEETLKPGDLRLGRVRYHILANPVTLRDTAQAVLQDGGWSVTVEPALAAGDVLALAERYAEEARLLAPGRAIVSVGEPTVVVRGDGRGGRAQHLALAVARGIAGSGARFLALGSDGSDGPTEAAGALVDGATWARARTLGLDPAAHLDRSDSHPLLDALGALVRTGPTGTNLLDLHIRLGPAAG
jgi:glycerate 2-kinase